MSDLLQFEDVFVEVLLQLFVGIVDTELLKRVPLEHLKPEYVKNSDCVALRRKTHPQSIVHSEHICTYMYLYVHEH